MNTDNLPKLSDEELVKLAFDKFSNDTIWSSLKPHMDIAEAMRKDNVPGWKRVWNEIIVAWTVDTNSGMNHTKVDYSPSIGAKELIKAYRDGKDLNTLIKIANLWKSREKKEIGHANKYVSSRNFVKAKGGTCKTCSEKKKAVGNIYSGSKAHIALSHYSKAAKRSSTSKDTISEVSVSKEDACIDCAISHLATATAYLTSNAERPSPLDQELAKGEIIVASRHLLALGKNNVYNMCVKILDSCYSENSLLSVPELKRTIQTLMDDK